MADAIQHAMTNLKTERVRRIARFVLATLFLAAGVLHLATPAPFLAITPSWAPWREHIVALTGIAELAGAIGLMIGRFRKAAGIGLALYAVCVFPANIEHARQALAEPGAGLGLWYHAPRLVFQPVIVWWALWAGGAIDWLFRRDVKRPGDARP